MPSSRKESGETRAKRGFLVWGGGTKDRPSGNIEQNMFGWLLMRSCDLAPGFVGIGEYLVLAGPPFAHL